MAMKRGWHNRLPGPPFRVLALALWTITSPSGAWCKPPAADVATSQPGDADHPASETPPRTEQRRTERLRMVEQQIARRGIRDRAVLEAMRNVPRHWFVPQRMEPHAYSDRPLPIGHGQTISQPYIVAFMTEALQLTPDAKVLEVGTGSGYQAAVLAEITPQIYTIEIVEPLAKYTIDLLRRRGYRTIKTRIGDGYRGWPEQAPFDAIIVTCAPGHVPPDLVKQLKVGGRLCIPVGSQARGQSLQRIVKQPDGSTTTAHLLPVRFVPMTGDALDGDRNPAPSPP